MAKWPPPEYRVDVEFHAPLDYVYRWCTDYRADDGRRAREPFVRKVLRRTRDSVTLQDLWTGPGGWFLNQTRTTLHPPNRWHIDSFGTQRVLTIEYTLLSLPRGRTRLEMRIRRRPTELYPGQPSRRQYEGSLGRMWRNYARALERDFLRTRRRSRK